MSARSGRTVIVLVVDGFGIGAMPDAGALRPGDVHADTCGHVLDSRPLRLPAFGALGLGLVHPHPSLTSAAPLGVRAGRVALGYAGADTYAGHQTMMGADFGRVSLARLADHVPQVTAALRAAGHEVAEPRPGVLLVDGRVLVHDNLEADPGVNWNASGRLADVSFDGVLSVARTVRAIAPVARVIAVAGHAPSPLTAYVRPGDGGTVGLDTPASGLYRGDDLAVRHLGAPLDHTRQLPDVAARAGVRVTLIGKAADILACDAAVRRPAVATADVLAHTAKAAREGGLIVTNVQETDLAGHQQDTARYARLLEQIDAGLAELIPTLSPGDRLIVTGDHGNDPTIGHAYHTREYVPVLELRPESRVFELLPDAPSLADVGATAAAALGLPPASLAAGRAL
ncbi:phosphopentomutase [Streptomyces sp. NPDC020412]|uniref:phosphopentomutase n=1 Tax=Streptomyces sp. NPDC020412 TaxID=3365073 RepID=UPI00379D131D